MRLRGMTLSTPKDDLLCADVNGLYPLYKLSASVIKEITTEWEKEAGADRNIPQLELSKLISANRVLTGKLREKVPNTLNNLPSELPKRATLSPADISNIKKLLESVSSLANAAALSLLKDVQKAAPAYKDPGAGQDEARIDLAYQLCAPYRSRGTPSLGGATEALGAAGSMSWEGALVSGLADFMVDRANQELVLWMVSSFQAKLCGSGSAESAALFPQTCLLLKATEAAPASHGALLASAIRADLESLPIASFGYLNSSSQEIRLLIQALRQRDVEVAYASIKELVESSNKNLDKICPTDTALKPACQISLISRVVLLVVDAIRKNPKGELALCQEAARVLREADMLELVRLADKKIISHLPPAAQALFDKDVKLECASATGMNPPGLKALTQIMVAVQNLMAHPSSADEVIGNGASMFRAIIELLWPADANTRELRIAIAATYTAEGLYTVLAGLQKGTSALELLAAMGVSLEQAFDALNDKNNLGLSLCSDPATGVPESAVAMARPEQAFCAIAATGVLLSRFGGVVSALQKGAKPGGSLVWTEAEVCKAIVRLAASPVEYIVISRLFGGTDHVPSTLKAFFTKSAEVECAETPSAVDGYRQVRALTLSIFDLEQRIRQWRLGTPPPPVQIASESLALTATIIESGAELLATANTPQLEALLSIMRATQAMLRGAYADGVRQVLVALAAIGQAAKLPESVTRYITLISDLASAKDPKDVSAALSAAAAPVGSWRAKRQSIHLSVTGVVGLLGGGEAVMPFYSQPGLLAGGAIGPMAALGFDLQFPITPLTASWSMGLFASVLDVGQLAWARVSHSGQPEGMATNTQTQVSTASEVSFLSVLSPGLYLKVGAGKTPFTFGIGASFAPDLRKYFYVQNSAPEQSGLFSLLRFGAFLAVDLTLFPIYVR